MPAVDGEVSASDVGGLWTGNEPWEEFINFRRRESRTGRSLGTKLKFQRAFHSLVQEFGLSPASRVRGSCSILKTTPILSTENCSAGD